MIPIDLSGKVALVTGVATHESFAWHIAKHLQAAGATLVLSCHPQVIKIVDNVLNSELKEYVDARALPFGSGTLKVDKLLPCNVEFDTMEDVDEKTRGDRRYQRLGNVDYSIKGVMDAMAKDFGRIDVLIHSVAYSPEIKNRALDTSRKAYLTALSISAYSLTALLRAATPLMADRPDGTAALGLTYLGGQRVVPHYGGGMSTAKAALEIDCKQLAQNLGGHNIRVNCISAGPWRSTAAQAIGDIGQMIEHAAAKSPMPRGIDAPEVANAAVFLCSPLASAITGEILFVDCGYNVMGV